MRRRRSRKRHNKTKREHSDYEVATYGPLRLERVGRFLTMSSHWLPGEFKEYIERVKVHRKDVREDIDKKISELAELFAQYNPLESIMFVVKTNAELTEDFLRLISATFGDNESFATFQKSPNWPTNDSVVYRRPLIAHEDKYYCFAPQILFRNLFYILEEMIREQDPPYFQTVYQKQRGEFLVKKALNYFDRLLPGVRYFKGSITRLPRTAKSNTLSLVRLPQ